MELASFFIRFVTNAMQFRKDTEEVKKSSKDMSKSLDSVDVVINKVNKSFKDLGKSVSSGLAAFFSARAVLQNITSAYQEALDLSQSSRALNVNIETLEAWGKVVEKQGGTAKGFESSIQSLAKTLNIRNQDAIAMLPMLADSFHNVGKDKSMRFGQSIGLDQATIMTLQTGRREVELAIARQKELGVVTQRDGQIAQEFKNKWVDMSQAFSTMWVRVGSTILPILTAIVDKFTGFYVYLSQHSDLIIGVFAAISVAVGYLVAQLIVAETGIILVVGGIALAIAAFALVFEDMRAFLKGNKSLIGDMLEGWPKVAQAIRNVFAGAMHPLQDFKALVDSIFSGLQKQLAAMSNSFSSFRKFISREKSNDNDPENPEIQNVIAAAQRQITDTQNLPIMAQTSNSIFNGGGAKSLSVTTGDITINTQATDAEGISGSFTQGLIDHFRQATGTFDDGVMA